MNMSIVDNYISLTYDNNMNIKTEVLHYLMDSPNMYISGTKLATLFSCSRMAVCKAVAGLQKEGYSIEASKHLGYKLNPGFDVLSKASLQREFYATDINGFYYDDIDSTNKKAKELLLSGAEPPFVVVAAMQSSGRGRLGRSFEAPEGGLYFSIALSGKAISSPDLITTSTSLAVARVIERLSGKRCDIKWVNDLYYEGKKVTGILTEGLVNIEEGGLENVVIGIGVNLNVPIEKYSSEIQEIATSLYPNGDCPFSRSLAIAECVKEVIRIQGEDFLPEYRERCFILGKKLYVLKSGTKREATALSIDGQGHLVVQYMDESLEALSSGEVSLKL